MIKRIKSAFNKLRSVMWRKSGKGQRLHVQQTTTDDELFKEKLRDMHVIMSAIDDRLKELNISRTERRRFWDDFRKYGAVRQDVMSSIISDLEVKETILRARKRKEEEVCYA